MKLNSTDSKVHHLSSSVLSGAERIETSEPEAVMKTIKVAPSFRGRRGLKHYNKGHKIAISGSSVLSGAERIETHNKSYPQEEIYVAPSFRGRRGLKLLINRLEY